MDDTPNSLSICLVAVVALLVARWIFRSRRANQVDNKRLYRVDHSVLNIPLPLHSLWMNMGFWKDTDDFPTACRALLEQVLRSAQILGDQDWRNAETTSTSLSILDLGFGCGDQCLYIRDTMAIAGRRSKHLKAYVGLTLEESHHRIAEKRLDHGKSSTGPAFNIFCADAAKPASWTSETKKAISYAVQADGGALHEVWVLGLDTFYHFQPSRWPVVDYASKELGASLMAFDLCVADNLSLWERLVIRFLAIMGQSPSANWVTVSEYQDRLVDAGYARENIEIRDISEHVFGALHRFMKTREIQLDEHGLSIGRFRYAAKMFGWWHKTGAVRGCIIIAKK